MSRIERGAAALLLLFGLVAQVSAQVETAVVESSTHIDIIFKDVSFTGASIIISAAEVDAGKRPAVDVVDTKSRDHIPVKEIQGLDLGSGVQAVRIVLKVPLIIPKVAAGDKKPPGPRYAIVFYGLVPHGKKEPLPVVSGTATWRPDQFASTAVEPTPVTLKKANARGDANVYVAGMINGSRGTDVGATLDLKLEYPFRHKSFYYAPFVTMDVSTSNPASDPNRVNFGLRTDYTIPFASFPESTGQPPAKRQEPGTPDAPPDSWMDKALELAATPSSQRPFVGLVVGNNVSIESDRDFQQTNLLFTTQLSLVSRSFRARDGYIYFRPYIGHEVGKNLTSPLDDYEGHRVQRAYAGGSITFYVPTGASGIESISFENTYVRRWLFEDEVTIKDNEDKTRSPLFVGTSPKSHFQSTFSFSPTKLFAINITYEYGQQPPLFKKIEHKVSLGFAFQGRAER